MSLVIAGHRLKDPLVLSPMVDVTDAAFRSVAKEWGADVTCSEMVAAIGLLHDSPVAWWHVQPWPEERPYGVQFMTSDPEELANAIRHVGSRVKLDFIDINLGCPAPNIMKLCAGGFLMKDPKQAGRVMRAGVAAAEEVGIPHVSAKMRLGPTASRHTYIEVGQEAEAAGIAWTTLHARTIEQGYSGKAEWQHIGKMVDALSIPVIGNGDLRTPADVVRMKEETDCAGFFIARAAMHDPTIFARMRAALEAGEPGPEPGMAERLDTLKVYLDRAQSIGMTNPAPLCRQAMRFVAGAPGAKALRVALQGCRDMAAVRRQVDVARAAA